MTLTHLVLKEIGHRRGNFALGVACVTVAVASLVGAMALLRAHDVRTRQLLRAKEIEVSAELDRLKDDYRKITKRMGFNVLILPKDQDLGDLYAEDEAATYMPESYVDRLADARIMSVRHLLPTLRQRVKWREKARTIFLIGARGEVPLLHRNPRKPIMQSIAPGTMIVGYELHTSLSLAAGDKVTLNGRTFTVGKLHPERGNKDDITIWINLKEAQEILHKEGLINGILALECLCAWADIGKVREEISAILPDTRVVEFAGKALGRAEARKRAAEHARMSMEMEKQSRGRLRGEREAFAAILVPIVIVTCGLSAAYLSLANVRERRTEIGILRALGFTSVQILQVFLSRAALIGAVGAVLGLGIGPFVGAAVAGEGISGLAAVSGPLGVLLTTLIPLLTPALSAVAAFVPALVAARQDPAVVLREE